jgi:DNA-binding NtrC family response regulator
MKEEIKKILIVHEKSKIAQYVSEKMKSWGCNVDTASSGYSALEKMVFSSYFLVMISSTLPLLNYIEMVQRARKDYPDISLAILDSENRLTEEDIKNAGVDYYIPDPMDEHLLSSTFYEIVDKKPALEKYFSNLPFTNFDFERLVGRNAKMLELYRVMEKLSRSSVTVLIQGESGTGKELTARAIHYAGERKNNPFVAVSCAAIPESLLESELFGHEKGAFTGAVSQTIGKFEQAHKGTIFLDEIAEMSPALQAKLLRVLEESEFQKVGGNEKIKVDVRIISATNKDLWDLTERNIFRKDLYYRLSAFPINLPPLRERKSDIPLLVKHFIIKHHKRAGKDLCQFDDDAMEVLRKSPWKGNIRELENVIERALVMCEGNVIRKKDLSEYLFMPEALIQEAEPSVQQVQAQDALLCVKTIEEIEKEAIIKALSQTLGNKVRAARKLNVSIMTLYRKIAKYSIKTEQN